MRTFTNVVARLMLIAAGVLIAISAVLNIMDTVKILNDPNTGWWQWMNETSRNAMILFFVSVLNCIIALTAFLAAIRGRRSFLLFLFALILMISPVWTIVSMVRAGTFVWAFDLIWKLILQFLAPILYFIGCLLLVRIRHRSSDRD